VEPTCYSLAQARIRPVACSVSSWHGVLSRSNQLWSPINDFYLMET